jgi:putative tryptophan/tyrosine transport system substrate-binding protein
MRRRDFMALVGGAAAAWPLTAHAQQRPMPVIGVVRSGSAHGIAHLLAAFRKGLNETGLVEGQNVAMEYRFAEGRYDRLSALAAELVAWPVNMIVALGGVQAALAAKAATTSIPIVFAVGADPVEFGLVASLARPDGNVTGVSFLTAALDAKRLGLLRELVPQAAVFAALVNPTMSAAEKQSRELTEAARRLGLRLHIVNASSEGEIETAFASMVGLKAGALVVAADPFLFSQHRHIVALAARHAIPAIYEWRDFAEAGGLASYGTSLLEAYRQAGIYTGRILQGSKPAQLPVMQTTKFEFVLNLKTAKALGLEVPPTLSARADEVIE